VSDGPDAVLVAEILDATERVAAYIAGEGRDGFMQQGIIYDAVCMNLLRIGECARFLSDPFRGRLPQVPWPDIISLRHRVAHGYETLKPEVLWRIASVNLPELGDILRRLGDA
jgi:uncharacterized protein with HEPN domain